jgi:CheY-like chemotaxis protein
MPKQYKFLLVDDSLLDLFIHKKLIALSDLSESITTFNSAEEALQFLDEQGNALEESVMLLDLQMPGMNGFEFIDEFAKKPEHIRQRLRIFILSSTVDQGDIDQAKNSPHVEEMLPKPVDVAQLKIKLLTVPSIHG